MSLWEDTSLVIREVKLWIQHCLILSLHFYISKVVNSEVYRTQSRSAIGNSELAILKLGCSDSDQCFTLKKKRKKNQIIKYVLKGH